MRTIIINTLGSELRQNPLFYLPFRDDQFHWMEHPLEGIDACVQQICDFCDAQHAQQDDHLIILVSLAHYQLAQYQLPREAYKEIIFAHLNHRLLFPLVQQRRKPLQGVSVVFVLPQPSDGTSGIPAEQVNMTVLGVDPAKTEITRLGLTDDDGNSTVDLTELFADILADYRTSCENELYTEPQKSDAGAMDHFNSAVSKKLKTLQVCKYLPMGDERPTELATEKLDFYPKTPDWNLFCIDLQINLSEHLTKRQTSQAWKLHLTAHDATTLRKTISTAYHRVRYLQERAATVSFFPLENQPQNQNSGDLSLKIWEELRNNKALTGIEDIYQFSLAPDPDESDKRKNQLLRKLHLAWLNLKRAKEDFRQQCSLLDNQYDPEHVEHQQTQILDICARIFSKWRREYLNRGKSEPPKPSEQHLPIFNSAEHQKALAQAQQEWGQATVDQLEDYTDVRQQAEEVKANFRKVYRLWPEGEFNATSKFFVYSAVLAVLFLLQMMIPYIGITLSQDGVQLSRYVHFLLSLAMFAALYFGGVLWWFSVLCRQINELTTKMLDLLETSRCRRRDSVIKAVETYGSILPKCTICYEQLQELQELHEANLLRKDLYNTHAQTLRKAAELLGEMMTLLRLPLDVDTAHIQMKGEINYQCPPSDPVNVPYYIFMCEKWGC